MSSKKGFASMDPAKQREIASRGGRAAHAKGTAREWTSEQAREAGRKGGELLSRDRAHMAAIGREGARKRHEKRPDQDCFSERRSKELAANLNAAESSELAHLAACLACRDRLMDAWAQISKIRPPRTYTVPEPAGGTNEC